MIIRSQTLNKGFIMNKIILFLVCIFTSGTLVLSAEEKMNETKNVLISSHIEYAKSSIEQRCQKLQKKIKNLENQLNSLEDDASGKKDLHKRRKKIMDQMQKCEAKIEALKLTQSSIDTINFKAL